MHADQDWKIEATRLNNEYFKACMQKKKLTIEAFEYKGYKGTAKIDLTEACVYGKVLYTPNLIMYSSDTVSGLKQAFIDSVDAYIIHLETLDGNIVTNSYNMSIDNFTK